MSEIMYDLKCDDCGRVVGQSSIKSSSGQICHDCMESRSANKLVIEQPPTLAERIAALEADVVKVTTVMVGKGDLQAKDVAVAIEVGLVEEVLEP